MVPDRVTGRELVALGAALQHWREKLIRRTRPGLWCTIDIRHSIYLLAAAKGIKV